MVCGSVVDRLSIEGGKLMADSGCSPRAWDSCDREITVCVFCWRSSSVRMICLRRWKRIFMVGI